MLKLLKTTMRAHPATHIDPAPQPGRRANPNLTRGEIAALFADDLAAAARPVLRA